MTTAPPRFVECEQVHAVLAVGDIAATVAFYTERLGFTLAFTSGEPPTFAAVNLDKVQMFLQKGTPDPKGCSVYFLIGHADALYEFHRANGVDVAQEIGDREYGIRDYAVRDMNGYFLSFGHRLLPVRRGVKQPSFCHGSASATYSDGWSLAPMATTMYCLPLSM
jgi:catechol 2,3-dioxygenase-like lactoylglutathione lyase family enzyme